MGIITRTIVFFLLIFASVFAFKPSYPYEEGVIILDSDNFSWALNDLRYVLVCYYVPEWVSQDKTLTEFSSAAQKVAELYPGVQFAKINARVNKEYAEMYEITDFPSFKFFVKGQDDPINYDGGYETEDFLNWIKIQMEKSITKIMSMELLNKQFSSNKHIGLYFGSSVSPSYEAFIGITTLLNDVKFFSSTSKEIQELYEMEDDSFVLFRDYHKEANLLVGPFKVEDLEAFAATYKYPAVMSFDDSAVNRIFNGKRDAIFLIRSQSQKDIDRVFAGLAQEYRNHLAFCTGVFEENNGKRLAAYFGVSEDKLPWIQIAHFGDQKENYILDRVATKKSIEIFMLNFFESNLRPYYKSGPLPEKPYDGDVRILVTKNFKEVVFDESKDAIVEFYLPTCGACKMFAPVYASFASKVKSDNLIIAKVDGQTNDIEGANVNGYPALKFYPRGQKHSPIDILARTEIELIEFLKEHATLPLSLKN